MVPDIERESCRLNATRLQMRESKRRTLRHRRKASKHLRLEMSGLTLDMSKLFGQPAGITNVSNTWRRSTETMHMSLYMGELSFLMRYIRVTLSRVNAG